MHAVREEIRASLSTVGRPEQRAGICLKQAFAITPDEEMHPHAAEGIAQADARLLGRVTYEMMESAWREPAETGVLPDWMEPWMAPFARTIGAAKKYVLSSTLERVDWNAELVRGDLEQAVQRLKEAPGKGLATGDRRSCAAGRPGHSTAGRLRPANHAAHEPGVMDRQALKLGGTRVFSSRTLSR